MTPQSQAAVLDAGTQPAHEAGSKTALTPFYCVALPLVREKLARMSDHNQKIREAVFNRLAKAGWITGTWVRDLPPPEDYASSMEMSVEWTDLGKAKIRPIALGLVGLGYAEKYEGLHFSEELGFLATVAMVFLASEGLGGEGPV